MWTRLAVILVIACKQTAPCGWSSHEPVSSPIERNLLVVVLDDVGADQLARFGAEGEVARTPTMDCLCDRGVRFERAWATPMCSPGRAALQTGRLADRTGIGSNVESDEELPDAETTIAEVLSARGYEAGLMGKWHLAGLGTEDVLSAPLAQGYDDFRGTPGNLQAGSKWKPPGELGYESYWRSVNGELVWTTDYATSVTTDDALDFLEAATAPWLLVVAFHSPHKPLHEPPADLISEPLPEDAAADQMYRAMLEATDTELGRLLRAIDSQVLAETTVVVTSDNGTSPQGTPGDADDDVVKTTLYERGIHVPLVFAGAGIQSAGASSDALVHIADLLPTFAHWTDAILPVGLDGVDLSELVDDPDLPGPANVRTRWGPLSDIGFDEAARDDRYKLVVEKGTARLYDLETDPAELVNLLEEDPSSSEVNEAYARLLTALAAPTADGRWSAR